MTKAGGLPCEWRRTRGTRAAGAGRCRRERNATQWRLIRHGLFPEGLSMDEKRACYVAGAFDPNRVGERVAGELVVKTGFLRFVWEEGRLDLPFSGLELRRGGANDRVIFFSHPSKPDWTLFTTDRSILGNPRFRQAPAVSQQIAYLQRAGRSKWLIGLVVFLAVVAGLWGLTWLKDPVVGLVARAVPASAEVKLGEIVYAQVESSQTILDDKALTETVRRMAEPLLDVLPELGYEFRFHIAVSAEINAFALPGGNVVLNSGLLLRAERPEEVLGVLAHELAHVTERHSLRQIISSVGLFMVVQTFLGDVSGLIAVVADGGTQLLQLGFSRDFEREADGVGWAYLLDARIDPTGMIAFFKKLAEKEKLGKLADVRQGLEFLSTHPATGERIERLEERWRELPEVGRFRSIGIDFPAFQERLRVAGKQTQAMSIVPATLRRGASYRNVGPGS